MSTKLVPDPDKKTRRTTALLPDVGQSAKRVSQNVVLRLFRHLTGPTPTSSARPTAAQRELAITGFILGVVSIFTSIFFVCGLLTSICGLLIGIHGRRKSPALHTITSWTIGLALAGLALSLIYTILTIVMSIYRASG